MVTKKSLGGRYQFIQVIGSQPHCKTYLMADLHYPGHPKCIVKHLKLPARNPITLKFLSSLLKKKLDTLDSLGQHDRIPKILAYFEEHQDFYIVQQYIPGFSLGKELVPGKTLPESEVLTLLREILEILAFVQDKGVIHRNICPTNIIRRQGDRRLVLVDFGLIKDLSISMAGSQDQVLAERNGKKMAFMAPEQATGHLHFSTDHFALGMVAIQAATGLAATDLPASPQPDFEQAIRQCLQIPTLREETKAMLLRMVHSNPQLRYQKATEALADLRQISDGKACPLHLATEAHQVDLPAPMQPRWPKVRGVGLGLVCLAGLGVGLMLGRVPQKMMAAWWVNQGQQAVAAGEKEQAIALYTRAHDLNPANPKPLTARSQLYAEQGSTDLALQDLTLALEGAPQQAAQNAGLYYQRANLRFQLGDLQGAITDYTHAIEMNGEYAQAYVNRGTARADRGDDQGAIDDYSAALALNPPPGTQAAAYLNRCLSWSNLGDQTAALKDCNQAINLRPNHSLAYENRGLVRRRMQDLKGSMQDYTIALQLNPDSPEPYYNLALTRQALGDVEGALADFERALELDPDHVFARYDRGLLLADIGRTAAAAADFKEAAQKCLDLGRTDCFKDAQYQLEQLGAAAKGQ